MSLHHPFGELLTALRSRKPKLSQTRLAELAGYAPAILVRMCQGKKDLTGPSGRERIIRILNTLCDEGVRMTLDEANALLISASLPPLFDGLPMESALLRRLQPAPATPHTNLLPALTSFIGREEEVENLVSLVARERLVTLTGAGGVGKTRIAMQVATRIVGSSNERRNIGAVFPDGVWLVELAPVESPARVAFAIAQAVKMQVNDADAALSALQRRLQAQHVLLVLDNCEHVIDACAVLAEALLRACPHVHVLATSREALRIAGEKVWQVAPLTTPTSTQPVLAHLLRFESVRLFVERTHSFQRTFDLTEDNAAPVVQICQRLDGIPLALELAAAQTQTMTVQELAAHIDEQLSMLGGGFRSASLRHHTLRSALDWSWQMLTQAQQRLLAQLSVFVGGWTLGMTQAVCEALPETLFDLVRKSLVWVELRNTVTRYRLLEPIRQYAAEKLSQRGEEKVMRDRHLQQFVAFAEQADAGMMGDQTRVWEKRVMDDIENVRAARAWSMATGDCESELRLAGVLWRYWLARATLREGLAWIMPALERCNAITPATQARALYGAAFHHRYLRDYRRMTTLAERGWAMCEGLNDSQGKAICLLLMAVKAQMEFDGAREAALRQESFISLQAIGDLGNMGNLIIDDAWSAIDRRDFAQAAPLLNRYLVLCREIGDLNGVWTGLYWSAYVSYCQDHPVQALAHLEQSVNVARECGVSVFVARSIELWGWVNRVQAASIGNGELTFRRQNSDGEAVAHMLLTLGRLHLDAGDLVAAEPLLTECLAIWEMLGPAENEWGGAGWACVDLGHIARLRGNLMVAADRYEEGLRHHLQAGATDGVATACLRLGYVACDRRDGSGAVAWFRRSMWNFRNAGMRTGIALALAGLADAAHLAGDLVCAARLAGAASAHLGAMEIARMRAVEVDDFMRSIEATKMLLGDLTCAEVWAEGLSLAIKPAIDLGLLSS